MTLVTTVVIYFVREEDMKVKERSWHKETSREKVIRFLDSNTTLHNIKFNNNPSLAELCAIISATSII